MRRQSNTDTDMGNQTQNLRDASDRIEKDEIKNKYLILGSRVRCKLRLAFAHLFWHNAS